MSVPSSQHLVHSRPAGTSRAGRRPPGAVSTIAPTSGPAPRSDNPRVADNVPRMILLGFGKYARSDKIYALEPLPEGERGHGARTRVWVEGVAEPIVASRTERAIVAAMGADPGADANRIVDSALDLAQRVADAAEQGRFDVVDLGRRARRLLQSTTSRAEPESLF